MILYIERGIFMSDHPVEGMLNTTMEKIKQMADANTVVGDPIVSPDGSVIIPVSKVSYGFASGGSDFPSKHASDKSFFGGGAGAGVTIQPIAFIAISNGNARLLQIDPCSSSVDRAISMVPNMVDTITGLVNDFSKKKREKEEGFEEEK